MKILLIEDQHALSGMMAAHLRECGFVVDAARNGEQAVGAATVSTYDAVILDLGLPDMDGMDVLRTLRAGPAPFVPALIVTARDSLADRVGGLDAGADDYIVKPFELVELEARLRAVLRRPGARLLPVHVYHDLSFEPAGRTAKVGQETVDLTRREAALFEELVRTGDRIVVRDVLSERLYGFDEDVSANALEATVSRLRRKLAQAGSAIHIETVRGIGYRLAAPVR